MSEIFVRSAFALGLALGPTALSDAPATAERCATVYDQTRTDSNTIDPPLAGSIALFNDKGVTTHIQILDGATENSITDNNSLAEHADITAFDCEWQDGNSIVLSLVRFTREESKANNGSVAKFDVRETGPIDDAITDGTINDAKVQLGQDLRNPADSYQEDLANFLKAINPQVPERNPNDTPTQPEVSQETGAETDWADVSKKGGIGLLVLSVAGGIGYGGYRAKRAYNANVFRRDVEADISEVISGILTLSDTDAGNIYSTGNQLDIPKANTTAHDDPALESLRSEKADLDRLVDQLRAVRDQIKQEGSTWSTKTLENLSMLQANYRQLVDESLPKEQSEYLAARNAAMHAIATVGDRATQVNALLEGLDVDIDNLEKSGWDVDALRNERGAFSEADGAADIAMGNGHLVHASNKIDGFLPQLVDLSAQVQTAETTLAANNDRHKKREDVLKQYTEMAEAETARMADLTAHFDSSCIDKVQPIKDAVASLSDQLHRKQAELSLQVDAKSFEGLRQTAALTDEYNSMEISLAAKRKELSDIVTKLEGMVEELPKAVAQTYDSYQASSGEVHEWGIDIDPALVRNIDDSNRSFEDLQELLNASKPAYFAIEEDFSKTTAQVENMIQTARSQHQEAKNLRSDITNGNESVKSELDTLKSYKRNHPDASHISVDIEERSFSTAGTREELRQTLDTQQELIDEISSTLREAKSAVAAAEAERRRLQEEERARQQRARDAAEAARRAAQQSASHNTGNVGGGGSSHNTGNL